MELNDLYGLDIPSQLKLLPSYELRSKLTHILSFDNFDLDKNYVQAINSKYYDLPEFSKLYSSLSGKTLSLFHVNTRSLSKNFDQLQNVLSAAKIDFVLIGITETKQQVDKDFLVNVNITGYHMYTQPSKSNAGGVAIYIKNNLDHFIRDDLRNLDGCFEAVWIEIKNSKGKNSLCGCIYRYPNTDVTNLMQYLEATFSLVDKKKYNIFVMGDFNIDLLQYESHSSTNDFLNTMISNSFLPYILQPTRVTDHSSTVIDNIFSNITDFVTSSRNITSLVADHFAQFLIIKKCHVSYKSCSYLVNDYSKFGKEKFIHDYSLINWSSLSDSNKSVNEHFNYFYKKTNDCINLHVQKKVTKNMLKLQSKPWINSHVKKLMNYRDKLFNAMIKTPSPSNRYLYKKFRNRVVSEQRREKTRHFQNYFETHKTNIKMLWTGIKSIVNTKSKNQFSQISLLLDNGKRLKWLIALITIL